MKWIAVISEAVKNGTSNDLLIPGIVETLIIVTTTLFSFFYMILYLVNRSKYMKKTYEEVVKDLVRFMEKRKIEQEYKDKMMFLLQKAKTDKYLLDSYKRLLFSYKIYPLLSKRYVKIIIDKHYEYFSTQN